MTQSNVTSANQTKGSDENARALVVISPNQSVDEPGLISKAIEAHITHVDLMVVFSMQEYAERRDARNQAGIATPYSPETLQEEATRIASDFANTLRVLTDTTCMPIGRVGRPQDQIQRAMNESEYVQVILQNTNRNELPRNGHQLGAYMTADDYSVQVVPVTTTAPDRYRFPRIITAWQQKLINAVTTG